MATSQTEETVQFGDGMSMTFLRNGEWVTRNHYTGAPDAEVFEVPPHWHETHDEIFRVIKGKLDVMLGSTWRTYTPEDGEILIPKGTVHSLKAFKGVELICEEKTDPMDGEKEMFFRNLFDKGGLKAGLFEAMLVFYHGDTIPAFPGHLKWLEKGFVTVVGAYMAPWLGYELKYKPGQKID